MAGKKNYNKISTEAKTDEKVVTEEAVNEEVVDEGTERVASVGIVCNCKKLNIRKKADVNSKSIGILNANDAVVINDCSDETFYEIITDEGELNILEAMKKFNGAPITFNVTVKSVEEHDVED